MALAKLKPPPSSSKGVEGTPLVYIPYRVHFSHLQVFLLVVLNGSTPPQRLKTSMKIQLDPQPNKYAPSNWNPFFEAPDIASSVH